MPTSLELWVLLLNKGGLATTPAASRTEQYLSLGQPAGMGTGRIPSLLETKTSRKGIRPPDLLESDFRIDCFCDQMIFSSQNFKIMTVYKTHSHLFPPPVSLPPPAKNYVSIHSEKNVIVVGPQCPVLPLSPGMPTPGDSPLGD